jgi:glutathione synthase/RimK-type ligase-like ATP-grasp enzyme
MDMPSEKKKVSDIVISNQTDALNVLVGFVNLAQQRGVFSIEESAKIWECVNKFQAPGN